MRRAGIVFILVLGIILSGCNRPAPVEGFTELIKEIKANPKTYNGQTVTLIGYFRAQDALDEIKPGFPPTDRINDWVLKDNSGAIYIAASHLLPFSATSQDIWRKVKVTGTVALFDAHSQGMIPYIVPQRIEIVGPAYDYDVLPAGAIFALHRFGGPDKLDHHIFIYQDHRLMVMDNKSGWRGALQLKEYETRELDQAFKKLNFFKLDSTNDKTCQNCVRYHIAALDTKHQLPHDLILHEGSLPTDLQAYIKQVLQKAEKAQAIRETLF